MRIGGDSAAMSKQQFDNDAHLDRRDRDQVEDAERGKGEEDERRAQRALPAAHAYIGAERGKGEWMSV